MLFASNSIIVLDTKYPHPDSGKGEPGAMPVGREHRVKSGHVPNDYFSVQTVGSGHYILSWQAPFSHLMWASR